MTESEPETTGAPSDAPADDAVASDAGPPPLDADEEATGSGVDLTAVARRLDDVERALTRLDEGTYWTDEITGDTISDERLADDPTARQA